MAKNGDGSRPWRTVLEIVSGIFAAVPVGIWLYFMSVTIWAEVGTLLAFSVALVPHIGPQFVGWMNFSRGSVLLLMGGTVAVEVWFCRMLIRRHYAVFAYTQAILGLAISSPFFYWTAVHQKPLLPFWGQ